MVDLTLRGLSFKAAMQALAAVNNEDIIVEVVSGEDVPVANATHITATKGKQTKKESAKTPVEAVAAPAEAPATPIEALAAALPFDSEPEVTFDQLKALCTQKAREGKDIRKMLDNWGLETLSSAPKDHYRAIYEEEKGL